MAYVGKITGTNGTTGLVGSTLYGTCATAAGTAAKVVTLADFDTLMTGVTVHVKFTNNNTAADPTLNVNSTGAKSICRNGTTKVGNTEGTSWTAGAVLSFTYDGTNWVMNDSCSFPLAHTHPDQDIKWGTANLTGSYNFLDGLMNQFLSPNRFAGAKAAGITIEYSNNAGSTWTTYPNLTDTQKSNIFTNRSTSIRIGGPSSVTPTVSANSQLRITVNTSTAQIYTNINKIHIYISTSYSQNCKVTIKAATHGDPTNFSKTICNNHPISGWSGWNVVASNFTTYGNTDAQYQYIQFIFTHTGTTSGKEAQGLQVSSIMGFGGVGWTCPSSLAQSGHVYSFDGLMCTTFPNKLTISSGGLNVTGAATFSDTVQVAKIKAPTTAGGTTYGLGTNGQFIRSNGTSSYWGSLAAADIPALNYVPKTADGVNAALNLLSTGSSTPTDNDWYISQYAGGGTTTTTFHRRPVSALWSYMAGKIGSAGSATQPVYVSSGIAKACTLPASGAWFSTVPHVTSDGVIQIGRYINFHSTNTTTNNYDIRFDASSTSLITISGKSGNAIMCIAGTAPTIRLKQTTSGKEFDSASIWTRPADTNGSQLFIQSGGITMIGSGEFCSNALTRKDANNETVVGFDNIVTTNATTEKLYIGSDNDVKIIANGQNIGTYNNNDHKVWEFETTGQLLTPGEIKDSLSAQHTMIAQSVRSSGNSVVLAKWIVDGAASTTYTPHISFYNMGGDATDQGAITLLPYHSNTSPWGGTIGLYIGKNILKLDNHDVLHAGNTSASTSTVSGATTIKSIKINNTNYNIYDSGNTDTKVTQSASTATEYRPIILGYSYSTSPADLAATVTNQVYATTNLFVTPSTGDLHIGHCLYGNGSANSTRVEVPLIGHNGTNIWIGSTAQQATHFSGKIHISTGYDSGSSSGNPTAWLDIPNADNTNSTSSPILHESFILHTTTSNANTWANLGCGISTVLSELHVTRGGDSTNTVPSCWVGRYCSGLVYGRGTTRGYISQMYSTPKVTLGGGRIDSSHTGPEWYFHITGTSETTYDLNNLAKVTQNVLLTSVTDTYPLLISNYKTSDSTTTTAAVANRIMTIYAKPSEGALYATKLALTDNCAITSGAGTTPYLSVKRSDLNTAVDVRVSGNSSSNYAGLYSEKLGSYLVAASSNGGTYLRTSLYRPSSQVSNLSIPFFGSTAGNGIKTVLHSDGYVVTILNGSTTTSGKVNLRLGNPTGQGTANNMEGKLIIYGKKTGWGMMTVDPDVSSNEWVFPKRSGNVAIVGLPVQLANDSPPTSGQWSITNSAFDWSDFKYIILRAYRYDGTDQGVPQEQESSLISYAWLLNQASNFKLRPGVLKIFNSTAFAYSFSSTGFQATIQAGTWDTGWLLEVWGVM